MRGQASFSFWVTPRKGAWIAARGSDRVNVETGTVGSGPFPRSAARYLRWLLKQAEELRPRFLAEIEREVAAFNRATWPSHLGLSMPFRIWRGQPQKAVIDFEDSIALGEILCERADSPGTAERARRLGRRLCQLGCASDEGEGVDAHFSFVLAVTPSELEVPTWGRGPAKRSARCSGVQAAFLSVPGPLDSFFHSCFLFLAHVQLLWTPVVAVGRVRLVPVTF